jgi:hypothetical protein
MVRDNDSLQAYAAFGRAMEIAPGLDQVFEEEWLLRGAYASQHLSSVAEIPDSVAGTPGADSILAATAEKHLIELGRVSLVRTDLRAAVLTARVRLLQFVPGREEDLLVSLTELDRMGSLNPSGRQRRMEILLFLAEKDIGENDIYGARERLLEVWQSSFTGVRTEAAYRMGLLEESQGDPVEALMWYNRACSVAPELGSSAAAGAAARRDSLRYLTLP